MSWLIGFVALVGAAYAVVSLIERRYLARRARRADDLLEAVRERRVKSLAPPDECPVCGHTKGRHLQSCPNAPWR